MAALSSVREMSMVRNNATNVALQLGAASLQIVLMQCCTCCCGTTIRVVVALQLALLWRYNSRCYGATTRVAVALQLALLRRNDVASCKLRCCGAAARVAALLLHSGCIAAALQLAWLHCCGTLAALLRHYNSRCYSSRVVFFFGMTLDKFKSLQPLPVRAKKKETESKKKQKTTLKPVLVLLFLAPPHSYDPSLVGSQRCKNISSLQPAPSSSANNTNSKNKFKNSTSKEFCCFQH
jgi:hypothetical protein